MKSYPIRVPGDPYRGRQPRRREKASEFNRVAGLVGNYINEAMANAPDNSIQVFRSARIAIELQADSDLVHDVISGIDSGSNGVTVLKGDYEKATDPEYQERQQAKFRDNAR